MSGGEPSGESDRVLARAGESADELYRVRDTFFPRDPAEKTCRLQTLTDAALALLDSLPPGTTPTTLQPNLPLILALTSDLSVRSVIQDGVLISLLCLL